MENLSSKPVSSASFYLYLRDKSGKRVGEGYLEVSNLGAGQRAKIPVSAHTMGSFATMELQPQQRPSDEPFKVKMNITSMPSGATLNDSQPSGGTPQLPIAPGRRVLEFSKEGYAASTPVEVAANGPAGSVEIELIPLTVDTVVLRGGTVLLGDVTSMTAPTVNITAKGKPAKLDRTRVARIGLGQRKRSATTIVRGSREGSAYLSVRARTESREVDRQCREEAAAERRKYAAGGASRGKN